MLEENNKIVIEDGKMEPVREYGGPEDLYQDLIFRLHLFVLVGQGGTGYCLYLEP